MRRALVVLVLTGSWVAAYLAAPDAQVRPTYDLGADGLSQLLLRLRTTASVLHTGAHPDDEDSAFLARMARGDHARVAYLSLNRGEGGQNILGRELFDALGVIRTEELLQARRLDGAEQFFTRVFDYGFSKTRAEAAAKWDERSVLGDMVRVIRLFRPLVVASRFAGTPADGHGQHQFAGYLTPLAVAAAADASQFPEQIAEGLRPWRALKLYRSGGFRAEPDNVPTIAVETGALDPVIGRSYAEIAAEGRSQHKSQQTGAIEPLGPATSALRLVDSTVPRGATEQSIFDGIDTSVPGISALAGLPPGALRPDLLAIDTAAQRALREYRPLDPAGIVPALAAGLRATRAAREALRSVNGSTASHADADFLLSVKERDFSDALARAAAVTIDPLADAETVVAGDVLGVTVRTFLANPRLVKVTSSTVRAPAGWSVAAAPAERGDAATGRREMPSHSARYQVGVPSNAALTQPYFLAQPRRGDSYEWPPQGPRAVPFDAPLLTADVSLDIGGVPVTISRPVEYRFADRIRGQLRREINVVPAVTVGLNTELLIVPTGASPTPQRIVVRATSLSTQALQGTLRLRLPEGWTSTPASSPAVLAAKGETVSAVFLVTPPPGLTAGTREIAAEAEIGGAVYSRDVETVAYPHIQTHRLYSPATAEVHAFDLQVASVHVGYIMGSGDEVPDALRRMGVDVTMIDAEALATGDLARFDTIVVGIRASQTRPDFVSNHRRLVEYMERGGTLIVQYQQPDYADRKLPPYPAQLPADLRVTDETAAVRILAPDHPIFTFPNRISAADFEGWVQERDLYAFGTLDSRYIPLLESADPGEPPQRGGEVYAEVGKGRYVYTAYSWFRQLPAGVPGAYRQFANLVSLSKAPRTNAGAGATAAQAASNQQAAPAAPPSTLRAPTRQDMLRGEYGRYRANNDLLSYHLNVRVDPGRKSIAGTNAIRFRMLADDTRIQLELYANLRIEKILLGQTALTYTRELNTVYVDFPTTLRAGREYTVDFHYSGNPQEIGRFGGMAFRTDASGKPWITTACEDDGASVWWPSKDQWRDEVENMEISVAIPNELVDVSNGTFVGKTDLGDGYTRWDWRVQYPINAYNVSLNIGRYTHFSDRHGGMPLDFYVMPENLEKARRQFAQATPMIEAFEHYFGEYPFAKDGYKLIEVPYSGMEHQSAVTYGNRFANGYLERDWTGVGVSPKFDFIIIHESAHEWFGNAVSAADVSDMWIHEGWATYLETLYVERLFGRADALKYVNGYTSKVQNREPIVTQRGIHRTPTQDMYFKGALFLHTLRSVVNDDDRWWKTIRAFYQRFKYQNILTEDVVRFFNAELGRDLTPIFDEYLRRAALPTLELSFDDAAGTMAYRWIADERGFAMPIRVGTGGDWVVITPTTEWATMRTSYTRATLEVATDLYYVNVAKQ